MEVQPIRNVSFKQRNLAEVFSSMNEEQLRSLAKVHNASFADKKRSQSSKYLLSVPIVDIFVNSAKTQGKLASKLGGGLGRTATWVGALAVGSAYSAILNKTTENVSFLKKFKENHPIANFFLSLIGFGYVLKASSALYSKALTSFSKSQKNIFNSAKQLASSVRASVDKSGFANKVYTPVVNTVKNFAEKAPSLKTAGKFAMAMAVPVALLVAISKHVNNEVAINKREDRNFAFLKSMQNVLNTTKA